MDNLDQLLLEAWDRIGARVRADRVQALKRSRRRFKGVLARPMREWCLVIRASDTRINPYTCDVELAEGHEHWFNSTEAAVRNGHPHTVTIDGKLIRRLTAPVRIPFPGVTYREAAAMCGREYRTIKGWVRKGVFRVEHYRETGFPEYTRRSKGSAAKNASGNGRGGRPYVWTPSPIDSNNSTGRTPHPVWGTLWQWLWERMPENYELVVRREARYKKFRGEPKFRGWDFICPGRIDAQGEHAACGRRCTYLYGPQTVWTLAKAIGDGEGVGFDMPEDGSRLHLAGQWFPGMSDPIAPQGGRSFACKRCWGVHSACMANGDGWNDFVSQISGGLLYGRDVPRPLDVCPIVRKMPAYVRKPRRVRSSEGQPAALRVPGHAVS